MKVKDHPLAKYGLIKDFDTSCITSFGQLTEEQKEYEIVKTFIKTISGDKYRVYVIASPATMREWNLKPMRYRFSAMEAILGQ
jgi:hypothetical protein